MARAAMVELGARSAAPSHALVPAKPVSEVRRSPSAVATAEPSNMTDMDVQRGESESQLHRTRPLAAPLGEVRPG